MRAGSVGVFTRPRPTTDIALVSFHTAIDRGIDTQAWPNGAEWLAGAEWPELEFYKARLALRTPTHRPPVGQDRKSKSLATQRTGARNPAAFGATKPQLMH